MATVERQNPDARNNDLGTKPPSSNQGTALTTSDPKSATNGGMNDANRTQGNKQ